MAEGGEASVAGGGGVCAWPRSMHGWGVHDKGGGHLWQRGACMVKGGMHGEGGMHGKGACMAKGGMYGKGGNMHGKGG